MYRLFFTLLLHLASLYYVQLTWTAPAPGNDPAVSYNVYRTSAGGTFGSTPIGTTTTTNYNDLTVQYGSYYKYGVEAVDANGVSSTMAVSNEVVIPEAPPPMPNRPGTPKTV